MTGTKVARQSLKGTSSYETREKRGKLTDSTVERVGELLLLYAKKKFNGLTMRRTNRRELPQETRQLLLLLKSTVCAADIEDD
jgi:hypothetical protein